MAKSSAFAVDLKSLETRDIRLVYLDVVHSPFAPYIVQCAENSIQFYKRVFDYEPTEKITVLLTDTSDSHNAFALASPRNTVVVQLSPPKKVYETTPSNERINHVMSHEFAHIVALDDASASDNFFRKVFFGKVETTAEQPETILNLYLTSPRFAAPRWYHEGVAVFMETWLAGGIGRAQGVYDEMVFRSMVRDGAHFYDPLGLESQGTKTDFQVGAVSYLYGARFVTYMGYKDSPEAVVEWISRSKGSKKYYAAQFKNVFGRSLEDAWREWIDWEHAFQRTNLDSIRQYAQTPYHDISNRGLGSVSRAFVDPDSRVLYAGLAYPGTSGHIGAISLDDGKVENLCDIRGGSLYYVTSLAHDPDADVLFYTAHNAEWRDLHMLDLKSGRSKRLIKDCRIGDLAFNRADRSLWGVRHFTGISTLVRIPYPYEDFNQIHSWPFGKGMYDLDISPDGRLLSFSVSEVDGKQTLQLVEIDKLMRGDKTSKMLHDFEVAQPANFVFSPDGRFLYGSAYFTGVSNIWRYDFETEKMEIVSNCETGMFRPVPIAPDSLIVFRFTGDGFVPTYIKPKPLEDVSAITLLGQLVAEKYPVVRTWNIGPPSSVNLDSVVVYSGPYKKLGSMGLASIFPVAQGYKEFGAVGLRMNLSDPAFSNSLHLTLSYTPTTKLAGDERLHADMRFSRGRWGIVGRYNAADFYDLFGPSKTSRKGYAAGLEYSRNLFRDTPKTMDLDFATTFYGDLDRVPYAQNIPVVFDQLWNTRVKFSFMDLKKSLGAVDDEKGAQAEVAVVNNHFNGKSVPITYGNFDLGVPVFKHSSIWLRNSTGISIGERDEPFANFFFGGFRNNHVDHRNEKRYREFYTFPGVEIDAIGGTTYVKSMLEWTLPPVVFERFGIPAFYITWARPALFTTGIITNVDRPSLRQTVANVGAQIDFRFSILSRLKMTFSTGYATAFEDEKRRSDEWMFSLKVL